MEKTTVFRYVSPDTINKTTLIGRDNEIITPNNALIKKTL